MLKKNNIVTGLLAGAILPLITWFVFGYILQNKVIIHNKPLIPYLAALAVNLFATRFMFNKGYDQTGAGIIVCSFAAMMVLYIFQSHLR